MEAPVYQAPEIHRNSQGRGEGEDEAERGKTVKSKGNWVHSGFGTESQTWDFVRKVCLGGERGRGQGGVF